MIKGGVAERIARQRQSAGRRIPADDAPVAVDPFICLLAPLRECFAQQLGIARKTACETEFAAKFTTVMDGSVAEDRQWIAGAGAGRCRAPEHRCPVHIDRRAKSRATDRFEAGTDGGIGRGAEEETEKPCHRRRLADRFCPGERPRGIEYGG